MSNVHQRLRKHLARCTLDCGFKTSESPALRGFVAERCPITGTSLYLVLKSNGLHRPKIRLKKFGFSPKIVPANISKKLPAQVLSQIVFHPVFQPLAQTAHVCLHSESGYTLGFRRKIAHNGSHGETRGVSDGGWYHYPRTVPHVHKHPRAGYQNGVLCRFGGLVKGAPKERKEPSGQRCAYARRCPEGVAAPLGCVIFLQFGDVALLWLSRRCLLYGVYCFRICRILRLLMTLHTFSRYF